MKMIKLLSLLAGLFGSNTVSAQNDPIILTINGEGIPQSEFMYIYTKNNPEPSFDDDSLDSYMELFINYKLKVKEARVKQYDTLNKLVAELAEYRTQLSLPYMIDQTLNETLIKEAYERTTTEVKANHILLRCQKNASGKDTLAIYNRAMALRQRILAGEDFEAVAKGPGGSEDPSVQKNGGELGYFSAFQMVYDFEQAAFTTPVGGVSMPIRTEFGYHIIKVFDKRLALGSMTAAHIMIVTADDMTEEEQQAAKDKIFEIYGYLKAGEKFEDLAAKYSDDKSSKAKGGLLPAFGAGAKQRMVPSIEAAVFALSKDGEYAQPVQTMFGWHIVKRIKITPVGTYEEMYRELKLKVERDIRAAKLKEVFINSLKGQYNYADPTAPELVNFVASQMDSTVYLGKWGGLKNQARNNEVIMSFNGKKFTLSDFNNFLVTTQKKRPKKDAFEQFAQAAFDEFVNTELSKYEDSQLEAKHPAFKSLIQEYSDGILVFEIMQKEIWDVASADSAGIRNYYEQHRADFPFPVRYDGTMYRCRTKEALTQVLELMQVDTLTPDKISSIVNGDQSSLNCMAKMQIFNSETTESYKIVKKGNVSYRTFQTGVNKTYEYNGEYYVMDVKEVLAPRLREFSEAKGLVTAAYQNQMEMQWLEQLRRKYAVVVQKEALHGITGK